MVASRCSVCNWSALYLDLSCLKYSSVLLGRFLCRVMNMIGDCSMLQCVWVRAEASSTNPIFILIPHCMSLLYICLSGRILLFSLSVLP